MAIENKRLIPGSVLGSTLTTYYTAGDKARAVVQRMSFTNVSGTSADVTTYIVPSGGVASSATEIDSAETVIFGRSLFSNVEGHVIDKGGTIQAFASTTGLVNIVASGVEIT